jgi:bifunctional non-homologous end joining protein LigD
MGGTLQRMSGTDVITHPEKVLFPEDGITKSELAAYYEAIAPVMLPHLRQRPVTMERFPSGIGQPGFLQKDIAKASTRGPAWLERVAVPKRGGVVHHPLVGDTRSLLWMANQNCITPHVWTSRVPKLYEPDLCVFDLDPSQDDLDVLCAAALAVRDLLQELDLPSWLKTSGSKGFHIVVPIEPELGFDTVSEFAATVAAVLVQRYPNTLTLQFSKAERDGRIFVDTGRNGYSATFAAAYAVRARPGAPVSAPCTWAELEHRLVGPRSFTLRSMPQRIHDVADLWSDMSRRRHSLRSPIGRVQQLAGRQI